MIIFVFALRLVIGLTLILLGLAVLGLGVAFLATIILWPIGVTTISAGMTLFVFGLSIASGAK